ncbi:hypothetical protein Tco_0961115 [Tanacetum coccineum]
MESFKIIIKCKVSTVRAREIIGWTPDFMEEDNDSSSDSGDDVIDKSVSLNDFCASVKDNCSSIRDSKKERDAKKGFSEEEQSDDPFGIYNLLIHNDNKSIDGTVESEDLSKPHVTVVGNRTTGRRATRIRFKGGRACEKDSVLAYGIGIRPEEEFERVLWGDLKTMFDPPSEEDAIWKLPHQQQILNWRYFHSCSVHCLTVEAAHIYMLTEVKYPLPPRVCKAMLEKKLLGDRKDESTMSNRHKDWLVQEQTALGKDFSNPFMADNLPKIEAHNEDIQRNLKFTSEDQVRGGLLGIIVNRLKSGSYRVKSGRHS